MRVSQEILKCPSLVWPLGTSPYVLFDFYPSMFVSSVKSHLIVNQLSHHASTLTNILPIFNFYYY